MSKYIDAIRQEIERQLEYFKGKEEDTWDDCDNYTDEDAMWYQGHWKMCSRLLSFIDSLPEEACKDSLQAPETCKENADSFTEDERIRKELIEYLTHRTEVTGFIDEDKDCKRWIAYLEKQKEQNSSALQNAFERSVKDYSLEEKRKASDYADSILPTSIAYGESDEEYKLHKIIEAAFIAGQKTRIKSFHK